MDTIIVNAVMFLFFVAVGEKSGEMFMALIIWVIIAALHTIVVTWDRAMLKTEKGREQLRREKRRDEKEWNEWRYKQDKK